MDIETAVREYEGLYRRLRGSTGAERRAKEQELAVLAARLRAHYEQLGADAYRTAMWERRVWLHEHGRSGEVYDGTDAIAWQHIMRRPAEQRLAGKSSVR